MLSFCLVFLYSASSFAGGEGGGGPYQARLRIKIGEKLVLIGGDVNGPQVLDRKNKQIGK
jgi:hypothetical protein